MASSIQFNTKNSWTVLQLSGRLVGRGNKELEEALKKLDSAAARFKAIDLSGVEFFDSYALGQILFICNSIKKTAAKIYLINSNSNEQVYINRLIKITELNQIIPVVKNLTDESASDPVPGA